MERELFGGAVTAQLPLSFMDASSMREVPDNQEMWVDSVSDASLILELVEHLPELSNAGSAGVFLQDAVEVDGSHLRTPVQTSALLPADFPHLASFATDASLAWGECEGAAAEAPVTLWLANVRLPRVGTDLLVTLHQPGGGDDGMLRGLMASLRIVDWGLFGPDGADS